MENEIILKRVVIDTKFNAHIDLKGDNPKAIFVSQEDLDQIEKTKCFDIENNCVIDYDNAQYELNKKQDELRSQRTPLLKAFDIYKSNVNYGIIEETEERKKIIIEWYKKILDLDEKSITDKESIPSEILLYL